MGKASVVVGRTRGASCCLLAKSHHGLAALAGCPSPLGLSQGTSPITMARSLDFLCISVGLLSLCPDSVTLLQIDQAVHPDRRMTMMLPSSAVRKFWNRIILVPKLTSCDVSSMTFHLFNQDDIVKISKLDNFIISNVS